MTKTCQTVKAPPRAWLGLLALAALLAWLPPALGQLSSAKVASVEIKHVGPSAVSDALIRANIRVKPGDRYQPVAVDDDVRNLYATGLFYNIRVAAEKTSAGDIQLTYLVQGNPRLTDIRFQGNKKFKDSKLLKKISSKPGEPFNERKLFTDAQEIQKMYQKAGYPRTEVKYRYSVDENTGRATATFDISEGGKIKIIEVDFVGAEAFPQKRLRKVIKTRRHWMFSWITGSGYLKEDQLEEDKEKLAEFYRDHGYLDFELKEVKFLYPKPKKMVVEFIVSEGRQYRVGSIQVTGNHIFTLAEITNGLRQIQINKNSKIKTGPHGLPMDTGDVFSPKGLAQDTENLEDLYGAKGYLDVALSGAGLTVRKIPNTETGTMDLEFKLEEGQKSYIEKIEIRGNTKTKSRVIRRELAVSPGEVFDMVRVKRSQQRLEGLQFFDKVDARPESTDIPNRKDLVISVDEKNTGNISVGAGFSSVDAVVGFVELSQGNFDLFHPPTFTGAGQKFRLRVQLGTRRQDYLASFVEPWFLGKKLALGVDAYYRDLGYESLGNLYDVTRAGGRVSLTRALGSDFLIGSVSYTLENVGIDFNQFAHGPIVIPIPGPPGHITLPPSIPMTILEDGGNHLMARYGASLAYDTRNSVQLPNRGQRTELIGEFVGGPPSNEEFYKLELKTAWYFKGFAEGHVLELAGRAGVAESLKAGDVPFFERYYLGGLYSLRGFRYRSISPREAPFDEPIGGDSYWFGTAEYSVPIIERLRAAVFYDIGNVNARPYDFHVSELNDNWGIGLRLNLPIGPLRLDYGVPIHHDKYNSGTGRFQFGVGYTREF